MEKGKMTIILIYEQLQKLDTINASFHATKDHIYHKKIYK